MTGAGDDGDAMNDPLGELIKNVLPESGEYIKIGPDAPLNFISEQDSRDGNCWDPETWVAKGYVRNWGDAAVMSPFFEVLRKGEPNGTALYVVLCPTFLRRPLAFYFGQSWGSY